MSMGYFNGEAGLSDDCLQPFSNDCFVGLVRELDAESERIEIGGPERKEIMKK